MRVNRTVTASVEDIDLRIDISREATFKELFKLFQEACISLGYEFKVTEEKEKKKKWVR